MDKETLRKVQLAQLEIAKELKRVCDENDIHYFMDSGTLLGAVRHKGFIPWDDDMDFGMFYEEYLKFLDIAPTALGSDFFLQNMYSEKSYPHMFSKILKKGTIYLEASSKNTEKRNELYIDIFPYYNYPSKKIHRLKQGISLHFLRRMKNIKGGLKPWINHVNPIEKVLVRIKYVPFLFLCSFTNMDKINKHIEKCLTQYQKLDISDYIFPGGISRYGKWILPKKSYSTFIDLEFEDTVFKSPRGYDEVLKAAYGDYMKLPPESERENRHNIIKVKL